MKRLNLIFTISLLLISLNGSAQSAMLKDFKPVCDSLNTLIMQRQGIESPKISLNAIMKRGNTLDFYFTQSLCDCPWHEGHYFERKRCERLAVIRMTFDFFISSLLYSRQRND